ncbi:MAG: chitobiase/beta-hexosaminidase C-terminal domain-containing protein [Terracidiphilus sp.]|jgi:hypothetical protein
MKTFCCSILALLAGIAPASAMTVTTPANEAKVTSPFNLVASTSICDSKPAVSMGYSIDHGPTTVVRISFSAMVTAPLGSHILHVKCWGQQVNEDKLLDITVVPKITTPPPAATPALSPPSGTYASAQSVTLSDATTGATIYYTTNGSAPTTSSAQYSGAISVATSTVINAVAVASGYSQSSLVTASYKILSTGPSGPTIPSNAISVNEIQLQPSWKMNHDPATVGNSQGTMTIVSDPSLSGQAAEFSTTFENWGGEIYSKSYANDPDATNFVYDNEIWIEAGSVVGNLELDNNQVIVNGDTVIYAFQCDGDHNAWDYSSNAGTPSRPMVKWIHSNQPCNPAAWTRNTWHHVQISYSRDDEGNVTYNSVWFDGVEAPINETVNSDFSLGWEKGDLMTNFQVDGVGPSGSSTLYADKLTISRW